MQITKDARDPVFVGSARGYVGRIELRIGPPKSGQTRYVELTQRDARMVGQAILLEAERAEERVEQGHQAEEKRKRDRQRLLEEVRPPRR